jgi:hypothetical protein
MTTDFFNKVKDLVEKWYLSSPENETEGNFGDSEDAMNEIRYLIEEEEK